MGKREVEALTSTIEAKTKQIGELGVAIVGLKEDLDDTSASLADDKGFLKELETSCGTKTGEWEERSKTRGQGTDEKNSQGDYETMMKDSAAKRTTDSKALSAKESGKADTEAGLQETSAHLADKNKELM